MNNFVYSQDPVLSADQYCDQHQGKLRLEFAQMLSTAVDVLSKGSISPPYKKTHANHPSAKWVRTTKENFQWSLDCLNQLNANWIRKGNKGDLIAGVIRELNSIFPRLSFVETSLTIPYLAMPDFIKKKWSEYNPSLGVWVPENWHCCISAYQEYTRLKTFSTNPVTKSGKVKPVYKLGLRPKYTINPKPDWYFPLHQISNSFDGKKYLCTEDNLNYSSSILFWDVQEPKELNFKVFGKKQQIPYKVWQANTYYISGYDYASRTL